MPDFPYRMAAAAALAAALAACGGGDENPAGAPPAPGPKLLAAPQPTAVTAAAAAAVPSAADRQRAARFLHQATFGADSASIAALAASTPSAWINQQFALPQVLHRKTFDYLMAAFPPGTPPTHAEFTATFWYQALKGEDQLRQRMTFALSQIFVISLRDGTVANHPRGAAAYYDTLATHAFGNFRNLLEAVALHPMMGLYLSHLRNRKESDTRQPDENFAREVMQLFTIGLHELNPDGTLKTRNGQPIETYDGADVAGLAKVFTGWSWGGPDKDIERFFGGVQHPNRDWLPMQNYPSQHSTAEKAFLGRYVGGGGSGESDLKAALDTLFQHPNVGPFIGRQLIQRLVSSNPSPAYVGRVAAAFNNNGSNVRGDMKAVIRAILLDPEARPATPELHDFRIREPVLRLANWMRAFHARSASGRYRIGNLEDPLEGIGQSPLSAPSVFNYYRPGYAPPRTEIANFGLVSPEMQIAGEPAAIGYINFMHTAVRFGLGTGRDVTPNYTEALALVHDPAALVDHVNLVLLAGAMSPRLRGRIIAAVQSVPVPVWNGTNTGGVNAGKNGRVWTAVLLAMASPEYIVQR